MRPKKGWHPHEVSKLNRVLEYGESKKSSLVKGFDSFIFWIVLAVAVFENIVLPVALIPLIALTPFWLYYPVAVILAVIFGYFFVFLIGDLDNIKRSHHIFSFVIITIVAVLNVYFSTHYANHIIVSIGEKNSPESPLLLALVFTLSFFIPYIIAFTRKVFKVK